MNQEKKHLLKEAVKTGLKKGISAFIWMLKILIPISFFTLLLDYSGVLRHCDALLSPLMGVLSLPSEAALPLIVGMLTGIYGAVAAMSVLPLTPDQMTLIAIFLLIAHGLIQESIVQGQSGMSPVKAGIFRLIVAVITVMICAQIIQPEMETLKAADKLVVERGDFMPVFQSWATDTALMCSQIFGIIMGIMVLLQMMKAFNVITHILRLIQPLLKIMGLERQVGMLWLTAGLFGIVYGGAVIVEEAKEHHFEEEDLTKLHMSIGINHAMIEDPGLFISLGVPVFWLWVPRLIAAIAAVYIMTIWYKIRPGKTPTS